MGQRWNKAPGSDAQKQAVINDMNNTNLLLNLRGQTKTCLFAKYEEEYRGKVSDAEFYEGCISLAPFSFLGFVSACLKERFDLQPFHRLIAALFEYTANPLSLVQRFIISAPPRAGKSMLTQYYVAWLAGLNPLTAQLFCSYGQRLSTKFMAGCALIMQSVEYQRCFPDFPGFATGSNTLFKTGGSIFGTSVGGALTGTSAGTLDIISKLSPGLAVMDDPLKSGESKAEIEALPAFWVDEFNTRRTGNWRQGLIATRFAVNDLHAVVLNLDGLWDSETNPTGWVYLNLAALCLDPENDVLGRAYHESIWPGHPTLDTAELLKLQAKNPWRFATVYQGDPQVKEGTIVLRSSLRYQETLPLRYVKNIILAIDSASGSSALCDNTSLTVAGVYQESRPVILEQVSGNWNIIDLRVEVAKVLARWKVSRIGIENASSGLVLIPDMIANTNGCNPTKIPIEKLNPQAAGGKVRRLQSVEDLIPQTLFCSDWSQPGSYDAFIEEMVGFPNFGKDDRCDSFVWALIMLKSLLTQEKDLDESSLAEKFTESLVF
jgi:phage terminase large subunit-like protein